VTGPKFSDLEWESTDSTQAVEGIEWEDADSTASSGQPQFEDEAPAPRVSRNVEAGGKDRLTPVTAKARVQMALDNNEQPRSLDILEAEHEGQAENVAKIDELLKRPNLGEAQRKRLTMLRSKIEDPFWTNQKTVQRKVGDNLARGAAVGLVNNNLLGLSDLALSLPSNLGIDVAEKMRGRIEEAQATVKLGLDPQGIEGTVGNVAGTLATGVMGEANPWAIANNQGFKALQLAARTSPRAAAALEAISVGFGPNATRTQKIIANLVGSGAVDVVQVADVFMNPRYESDTQRMQALAAVVGPSTFAAALSTVKFPKFGFGGKKLPDVDPTKPAGEGGSVDPARAAQAAKLKEQESAMIAQRKAEQETRKGIRSKWEAANPGKSWTKDLTKVGQQNVINENRVLNQPEWMQKASKDQLQRVLKQLERSVLEAKDEATAQTTREAIAKVKAAIETKKAAPPEAAPVPDSNVNQPEVGTVTPEATTTAVAAENTWKDVPEGHPLSGKPVVGTIIRAPDRALQRGAHTTTKEGTAGVIETATPSKDTRGTVVKFKKNHAGEGFYEVKFEGIDGTFIMGEGEIGHLAEGHTSYGLDTAPTDATAGEATPTPPPAPADAAQVSTTPDAVAPTAPQEDGTALLTREEANAKIADAVMEKLKKPTAELADEQIAKQPDEPDITPSEEPEVSTGAEGKVVGEIKPDAETKKPVEEMSDDELELSKEELEVAVEHLARTVNERMEAQRGAEIDPQTGLGNANAWAKAQKSIDADPEVEVVYADMKSLHAGNAVRTHEGMNAFFARVGDAIRQIEHELGIVQDGSRGFRVGGDEFAVAVPKGKAEAFAKRLRELIPDEPITGVKKWKKYVTGISVAHGKNTVEADRALTLEKIKTLKPSEEEIAQMTKDHVAAASKPTKPRGQKKAAGPVNQTVEGFVLEKSISDMTSNDLDKTNGLLDKLEDALDAKQITLAAYGDALRQVKEHRRTLPPTEKAFTVEDFAAARASAAAKKKGTKQPVEGPIVVPDGPSIARAVVKIKANGNEYRALNNADAERQAIKAGDLPDNYHTLTTPEREKLVDVTYEHVPVEVVGEKTGINTMSVKAKAKEPVEAKLDNNTVKKAPVKSMNDATLDKVADALRVETSMIGKIERRTHPLVKRLDDVIAEQASRRNNPGGAGGMIVQTNPAVTGFVAGFAGGFLLPADSDQQRLEHALYIGVAGALGASHVNKRFQQAKTDGTPAYQRKLREKVRSIEDQNFTERIGLSHYLHNAWMGIARRSLPAERLTAAIGRAKVSFQSNLGKQAELFGLYRGRTDAWVKGDGPAYFDELGNPRPFLDDEGQPIPSLQHIAALNDGDTRTIGDLAAAARELEVRATRGKTLGIDYDAAREMFTRATPKMHKAREALTKYFRALADLQVRDGLISAEVRQKFNSDEMYVAIRRLFNDKPGQSAGQLDVKKNIKGAAVPQTSHKMVGSTRDIQNPFEAAIDMTGRIQRAAELNKMAKVFVQYIDLLPKEARQFVGQRLSKAPDIAGLDDQAKALKADLAASGTEISASEAKNMLMGLTDESLNVTNGILRYYENGEPVAVRLAEPFERMFRSFRPQEMQYVMAGLAPIEALTNVAKIGITANPVFVAYQSIRDVWQYYMNGAYGGTPGISLLRSAGGSIAGAFHIITKSPEYRKFITAGGVGDSIASQGLQVTRDGLSLLRQVQTAPARTKIGEVINDAKTLTWTGVKDAYANAIISISDAARVGAYLSERGRGSSVLDAVYSTKKYGANFSNRGDWAVAQALNKMTLFLNPSIQGMSATFDAAKEAPAKWFARGVAGVMIPSMLLYFAYEDDEQIKELRGTPSGRKFWWMRGPDHGLIKIPKPLFEGELFGTAIEAVLDNKRNNDPIAYDTWKEAMLNDVQLNLTPLVASVPLSLWANKDLNFGGQITPDRNLDPQFLRNQNTTGISQEVSSLMGKWTDDVDSQGLQRALSPAGLDYIARNLGGTLTYAALQGISNMLKYSRTQEMPMHEEIPFVGSAFPQWPAVQTQSIHEFYIMANKSDRVEQGVKELVDQQLGVEAGKYAVDHIEDLGVAELYRKSRADLTDMRKAIQDIRQLDPKMMPQGQTKESLIREIQEAMIELAKQTNLAARSAKTAIAQQQTANDSMSPPTDSIMNR